MLKKVLSIVIAAALSVGATVSATVKAGNDEATTRTEKIYLARANDPINASAVAANFGGVKKAAPYNTYEDSENGTRGAYVAANPAQLNAPFIQVYHENGVDLTKTTGVVYVNLYWTGTANSGEILLVGFASGSKESAFSTATDPQWPVDATSLSQGWNRIPFPVGTQEGLSIDKTKVSAFRVYNPNVAGTTGLACGAVYAVDKDDATKKYYFVNAQDEMSGDFLANTAGISTGNTYTAYDDNTCGAYVCGDPTKHAIPFMVQNFETPVSLAETTGKVTFNLYHKAETEESKVIIPRLVYEDGQLDIPFNVQDLKSGWNAVTLEADTSKNLKGILVYAEAMAAGNTLAVGSVYVTKEVANTPDTPNTPNTPNTEDKPVEVKYVDAYIVEATSNESLFTADPAFLNDGFSAEAPYNGYGDNSRGAYKAKVPLGSRPGVLYETFVIKKWTDGLKLTGFKGIVTANVYYKGTQGSAPLVFTFSNKDEEKIEYVVDINSLVQGWNKVEINLAQLIKDKKIEMEAIYGFSIYTVNPDKLTNVKDLAFGAVTFQKPDTGDDAAENKAPKRIYLVEATDKKEVGIFSCAEYFDANFNAYGDKTRGAYVRKGAVNADYWVAKVFNNVDITKEKYAFINFYVDDPEKFGTMFIELSSSGTWDNQERTWVLGKSNVSLKKGWNVIKLDLNNKIGKTASDAVGYATTDVGGDFKANAVNFIRIHGTYSGSTSAVGAVYLDDGSPDTGDNTNMLLFGIVGMLALLGAAYTGAAPLRKKRR